MKSPVQVAPPLETDIVDRITDSLPVDLRADFYREMRHCRSLPENDEMLRILRAMQFLTILIHQAPARLAAENGNLNENLTGFLSVLGAIEKRLDDLPTAVSSGIGPEKVAAQVSEGLRQQFFQTTIPQTAQALTSAATELKRSVAEVVTAVAEINRKDDGASAGLAGPRQRVYRGEVDSPKSSKSIRKAALSETLLSEVAQWRALCANTAPDAWVFPSETGETPIRPNSLWRRVGPKTGGRRPGMDQLPGTAAELFVTDERQRCRREGCSGPARAYAGRKPERLHAPRVRAKGGSGEPPRFAFEGELSPLMEYRFSW